jgi:tRNA dimethylallyltransferase
VTASTPRVVAVVGPTAAGKSALGLRLARELGGEVVNADSMQLYRGMDIGTAKLAPDERQGVPHHLLDVWDVRTTANVAAYQALARSAVDALLARGRSAVLVGGSGLYVRAVVDDLRFPATDPQRRAALEAELVEAGPAPLHARLAAAAPEAAAAILPSNGRRIVRALEVVESSGSWSASLPGYDTAVYDAVHLGVDAPDVPARIEARVDRMWEAGLVEEVRGLEQAGLRSGVTASRAVGYAQVLALLDGRLSDEQARARTVHATRRLARRQRSWWRRDFRVTWLGAPAGGGAAGEDLLPAALRVLDAP